MLGSASFESQSLRLREIKRLSNDQDAQVSDTTEV